jgi:hypothetical protein
MYFINGGTGCNSICYNFFMWKILLAFLVSRAVLFLIALVAINYHMHGKGTEGMPRIENFSTLVKRFAEIIQSTPEASGIERIRHESLSRVVRTATDPFVWCARVWMQFTGMGGVATLLWLSNLCFLFFLFETFVLLSRMVLLDTASYATLLLLFWPGSYELSTGASFSFTALLCAVSLRRALDNQWLLCGCAVALLGMMDPIVFGWIPLLLWLFWYYQRHFQVIQVLKRVVFFLLPLAVVVVFRWHSLRYFFGVIHSSALIQLIGSPGAFLTALLSFRDLNAAGPAITFVVFTTGAILCLASHTSWLTKLTPAYCAFVVLAFSSMGGLPLRITTAGTCLAGIAHVASGNAARVLCGTFLAFSAIEVFLLFSAA